MTRHHLQSAARSFLCTAALGLTASLISGCQTGPATIGPAITPDRVVLTSPVTADTPIIDGVLDEPMWQQAPVSDRLYSLRRHPTLPVPVDPARLRVRMTHDSHHLYVAIQATDTDILAQRNAARALGVPAQPPGDLIELTLMPVGVRGVVYEIRVNPINRQWDARYIDRRVGHVSATPGTWNSGMKAEVTVDGEIDTRGTDRGWTVEMAIPLVSFTTAGTVGAGTGSGREWHFNVTHYDYSSDVPGEPERLSIAPITAATRQEPQIYPILLFP